MSVSPIRCFFDANILLYAIDANESRKRDIARDLLRESFDANLAFASTPVLGEFSSKLIHKFKLTRCGSCAHSTDFILP